MKKITLLFVFILLISLNIFAQEEEKERKMSLNGYINNMQSFMIFEGVDGNWINDNLIHNRLNFKWFPSDHFSFDISTRTRFFSGETVKYTPGYDDLMEKDNLPVRFTNCHVVISHSG